MHTTLASNSHINSEQHLIMIKWKFFESLYLQCIAPRGWDTSIVQWATPLGGDPSNPVNKLTFKTMSHIIHALRKIEPYPPHISHP